MLRRLPECHKLNACALIPQLGDDCKPTNQAVNMLYQLPHADGRKDAPQWPTIVNHQKFGDLEVSAQGVVVEESFYLHVFDLVEMSNILDDQIPKLLFLRLHLRTRPACSDQQGAIACIPKDDI